MSGWLDRKCAETRGVVEARGLEYDYLWSMWAAGERLGALGDAHRVSWEDAPRGVLETIGHVADMLICVSVRWATVAGYGQPDRGARRSGRARRSRRWRRGPVSNPVEPEDIEVEQLDDAEDLPVDRGQRRGAVAGISEDIADLLASLPSLPPLDDAEAWIKARFPNARRAMDALNFGNLIADMRGTP